MSIKFIIPAIPGNNFISSMQLIDNEQSIVQSIIYDQKTAIKVFLVDKKCMHSNDCMISNLKFQI